MSVAPDVARSAPSESAPLDPADVTTEPQRQPLKWVVAAVVLVLAAQIVWGAATNPRIEWGAVGEYLLDPRILSGLQITIGLTLLSQVVGTTLGMVVAWMSLSHNPVLIALSRVYVTIFRTVPTIIQVLFWYYLAAVLPTFSLGVPFGGPALVTFDTNALISQFTAAILGLALAEGAFLAEYFRGGVMAVPKGQLEAAASCGLTPWKTFHRIVLPQAARVVLPSYGNATIINMKNTSVVFVIGAGDLMTRAQLIYSQNFQQIPLLVVVVLWYLVLVALLTVVQRRVEAHYARGYGEAQQPPWWRRLATRTADGGGAR